MSFKVNLVSRSYINLESDEQKALVEGEALIPKDKSLPCYVVYLNSASIVNGSKSRQANDSEMADIVVAIKEHFGSKGSIVDFE